MAKLPPGRRGCHPRPPLPVQHQIFVRFFFFFFLSHTSDPRIIPLAGRPVISRTRHLVSSPRLAGVLDFYRALVGLVMFLPAARRRFIGWVLPTRPLALFATMNEDKKRKKGYVCYPRRDSNPRTPVHLRRWNHQLERNARARRLCFGAFLGRK